jgi:ATP-dependent protease Clp ATPase subunit
VDKFPEHVFQLVKHLDQFVIGQATAKKVLSVA